MSLTNAFKSAVASAFTAAGDLAKSVTYTQVTEGTESVLSSISKTEVNHIVTVLIYGKNDNPLEQLLVDAKHTGDLSCLIQTNDLSFTPSTNDYITSAGELYWVRRIIDHFGIVYEMSLERRR